MAKLKGKYTAYGWCKLKHRVCTFNLKSVDDCPYKPNQCGFITSAKALSETPKERLQGFDSSRKYPQLKLY